MANEALRRGERERVGAKGFAGSWRLVRACLSARGGGGAAGRVGLRRAKECYENGSIASFAADLTCRGVVEKGLLFQAK